MLNKVKNKKGEILKSGAIIVKKENDRIHVLLIYRAKYADWSFPKGHSEVGESFEDSMKRELREETGLEVRMIKKILPNRYFNTESREKTVCYMYLVEPVGGSLEVEHEGDKLEWVELSKVRSRLSYPDLRKYFDKILKEIKFL